MADSDLTPEEQEAKENELLVERWKKEKNLADKRVEQWFKDVKRARDVYMNLVFKGEEGDERKETFNILYSNIQTKRPVLYSQTPRPDIRRRWKEKNILAAAISEILERASSFTFESSNLDGAMIAAVNDLLLPGRGVTRVKYIPTFEPVPVMEMVEGEPMQNADGTQVIDDYGNAMFEMIEQQAIDEETGEPMTEDELRFEEVDYEQWQYDRLRFGPTNDWKSLPWLLFIHYPTKEEAREKWPDHVDDMKFTKDGEKQDAQNNNTNKKSENEKASDDQLAKTAEVWEIFIKDSRQVLWISPDIDAEPLDFYDDPLKFEHFWPIPKPLDAIENSTSFTPVTEFSMYETLAMELEEATNRVRKILKGIRVRGAYDGRLSELEKILEEDDNGLVPLENAEVIIEKGLEAGIWMLPLGTTREVLRELREFRAGLIQQIYEITGISDIFRGTSNPHETAKAQSIKANFGKGRMEMQQKEVQRYARDLLRMTCEVVSDFEVETLELMTGLNFPTAEEKQFAIESLNAQAAMVPQDPNMPPPEPDPQLVSAAESPSWDEIQEVLHSDVMREFLIDIETNSTIEVDETEDRENVQQLFTAIVQFMQASRESGFTPEVNNAILASMLRRFKFGREVEDALDEMLNNPPPDPGAAAAEADAEMKAMDKEIKQLQLEEQREKTRTASVQAEADSEKAAAERAQTAMDMEFATRQHNQRMTELGAERQSEQSVQ